MTNRPKEGAKSQKSGDVVPHREVTKKEIYLHEILVFVARWTELVVQQEKITERKRNVNHKNIRPTTVGLFFT